MMNPVFYKEVVSWVHHWNDSLFSFKTSRSPGLRFESGQFVMIGLEIEGRPLLRAYSVVSPHYEDYLEFYSIKVPDGALTSRLQHLQPGGEILIGRKATGTLLKDNLLPGRNLFLLSSGTGLAPFMSIVCDPAYYEDFQRIVLVHSVRYLSELGYYDFLTDALPRHEYLGEQVRAQLIYYPTVTREPYANQERITHLLHNGALTRNLGLPELDPQQDRVMICGNPSLLSDLVGILQVRGFTEGSMNHRGGYVIERAFVEK